MGIFKIMFTVEAVKIEAIIGAKKWVIGNNWHFWNFIYPCHFTRTNIYISIHTQKIFTLKIQIYDLFQAHNILNVLTCEHISGLE